MKKAAYAGHHYAQFQYALACWNGEGVPRSEQEYIKWMRESAGNGNDEAIIRWAWTRFTGVVQGVRCDSQQELDGVRTLLEDACADGDDFFNQDEIRNFFQELHNEEARLGRRLSIEEMYGTTQQVSNSNVNSNSGGCYVATAVYGSYDCPQVWTLRRFRSFSLAKNGIVELLSSSIIQ